MMLPLATVSVLRQLRNGRLVGNMWEHLAGNPETGVGVPTIPLVRRAFTRAVKQAKLPDIGLYGLRHTHATLLLSLGVPIKVVSERLGHSKVQITMDTYQHVLPHMQEEVAAKLESALGG
jgi:integrase